MWGGTTLHYRIMEVENPGEEVAVDPSNIRMRNMSGISNYIMRATEKRERERERERER